MVVWERLHRYNHGLLCGASALRRRLDEHYCVRPLPSVGKIGRILTVYGLTHGRTGWYEGEDLDWLPGSAQVPASQRKEFEILASMPEARRALESDQQV